MKATCLQQIQSRSERRNRSSWTFFLIPPASGCTWGIRSGTSRPTSSRAFAACRVSTFCTAWVSIPLVSRQKQCRVQTNRHPRDTTNENVANMLEQLRLLGLGHDEDRRFLTSEPDYYRWTQWIFLVLYESVWDVSARWEDTLGRSVRGRAIPATDLRAMLLAGERFVDGNGLAVSPEAVGSRRALEIAYSSVLVGRRHLRAVRRGSSASL